MEIIITDRLVLRQPQKSDKDSLFSLLNDYKVQEFLTHIFCESISDINEFLFLSELSDFETDFCFILESKENKEIIGLIEAYVTSDNILCISYAIKESYRGKGFICEALKEFIIYVFQKNLNILFVEFSIRNDNNSSIHIMRKLNIPLYRKMMKYSSYRLTMQERPSW